MLQRVVCSLPPPLTSLDIAVDNRVRPAIDASCAKRDRVSRIQHPATMRRGLSARRPPARQWGDIASGDTYL